MKILALILTLFLVSCSDDYKPMNTTQSNNPNYAVDFLFEKDGCKIYRFYDKSYYRYFTNCTGKITSHIGCGKNCSRPEEIETVNGN